MNLIDSSYDMSSPSPDKKAKARNKTLATARGKAHQRPVARPTRNGTRENQNSGEVNTRPVVPPCWRQQKGVNPDCLPAYTAPMPFAELDGARIYYEQHGNPDGDRFV